MPLLKANDFWKPNTYYYATDRYKSLIEKDNTLYICNESHFSQDEFDNSKFTSTGSGGGTGGADLSARYSGEWDLYAGESTHLVEAFPGPNKSTGYVTISNDLFQYVGDGEPSPLGNGFVDFVVAEGASTVNTGIRSFKINVPDLETSRPMLFGLVDNNRAPVDLYNSVNVLPNGVSGLSCIIFRQSSNDLRCIMYPVNNGVLDPLILNGGEATTSIYLYDYVVGEPIYFDFDTATGGLSVTVSNGSTRLAKVDGVNFPPLLANSDTVTMDWQLDVANFQNTTFAPFYGVSYPSPNSVLANIETYTFDLGTTDDGRLPFLSPQRVIEPPLDADDGQVYKVVGNGGTYLDNPPIYSGDYVEFSENIQKLIITRPAPTNAGISNTALARVVGELGQGGVIYDAINKFTTQTIAAVNGYGNVILASSSYVELSNGGLTGSCIVTIPINVSGNNLKVGQRLYIMSTFTSNLVRLSTLYPTNQIGLSEVAGVTAGVTYEYVIVRIVSNKAVWLRIK